MPAATQLLAWLAALAGVQLPAPEPGLPAGWAAHWSQSRAAWYWKSEKTGESAWTKPTAAAVAEVAADDGGAPLPAGWVATWSDEHQAHYFVREEDGESTWTRPTV